jgi:hypothetical protein
MKPPALACGLIGIVIWAGTGWVMTGLWVT